MIRAPVAVAAAHPSPPRPTTYRRVPPLPPPRRRPSSAAPGMTGGIRPLTIDPTIDPTTTTTSSSSRSIHDDNDDWSRSSPTPPSVRRVSSRTSLRPPPVSSRPSENSPRRAETTASNRVARKSDDAMNYSTIGSVVGAHRSRCRLDPESSASVLLPPSMEAAKAPPSPSPPCPPPPVMSFASAATLATSVLRLAASALDKSECDYDVDPTELYLAVQDGRWGDAIERCITHPREASTWVYRKEGRKLRWRLLPLHAAALFRAPEETVRALLEAYPGGASLTDDQGKLPLHLCLRTFKRGGGCEVDEDAGGPPYYDEGVVSLLADAFPGGARASDGGGRTPLDLLAAGGTRANSDQLMRRLLLCDDGPCQTTAKGTATATETAATTRAARARAAARARVAASARATATARATAALALAGSSDCATRARPPPRRCPGLDPPAASATMATAPAPAACSDATIRPPRPSLGKLMARLNRRREEAAPDGRREANDDGDGPDHPNREEDDDRPLATTGAEQGVEVEYDVDEIIGQGTGEEEEEDTNDDDDDDDMGVEVEYDVDEIMMRETEKEEDTNDDVNKVGGKGECDEDEITMREGGGEVVVPPPAVGDGSSPPLLSGGDRDENGVGSAGHLLTYRRPSNRLVDMAPPSLREQMRARVESRMRGGRGGGDDHGENSVPRLDCSRSRGDPPCRDPVDVEVAGTPPSPSPPRSRAGLEGFLRNRPLTARREGGGRTITDAAPSLDDLISVPSSICSSTTGGNSSATDGIGRCGGVFGINGGNAWERTTLESTTEERDDEAAHVRDQQSLRPQSSLVSSKSKMKPSRSRCVDGDDKVIIVSSTICSSTTGGTGFVSDGGSRGRCVGLDKGDARERTSESVPAGRDDALACIDPPPLSELSESKLEVYNSTSMETAPTIDMTEAPSSSYDEGSLCETYTSSINRAKVSEVASHNDRKLDPFNTDLSTPKFLIALSKFKNPSAIFVSSAQSENGSDIGENHDDDATLNLLEKAEQLFSAHSREDPVTPSSPMSRVDSGSSITQSKFDQIMAKYENMSVNENEYKAGIHNINNRSESLLESITPCHDSCGYPSARLNKLHTPQIKLPASTQEYGFSKNLSPPKSHLRERPQILDPPEMSELLLQPSFTESNEAFSLCIRQVRSFGSDAVSALSMLTGNTTVGSVSISTENSAVIESHVQAIVHNIVACEVENAGSMKKELEAALKDKLKLKAKVNKLVKTSDEQSLLLAANHIKRGKFNREMEIQLARKAAELEKCTAVALNQAEESKRRALELAQQDMEKEISLLRSQLDAVQSIGVPIDRTLRDALGLVELNQRALRKAAERDAKSALEMKEEIEQSFVNAVMEFEAWSEKQLRLMESRWERFKT